MKLKLLAATAIMVVVFGQTVKAEELPILERDKFATLNLIIEETKPKPPEPPKPIDYIVVEGDSLTKIANAHSVDLSRLWAANPQLTDPDLIEPEKPLKIPENEEILAERPFPTPPPIVSSTVTPPINRNNGVSSSASKPTSIQGFIGSKGWVKHSGNCVNTARAHGKVQNGNPITWKVSTRTPFIGAAALHHYNHVSVVSGIYENGDIEVMHENFRGNRTRFKASEIRGYF
jgi:LysM repeat protein